ncbi:hypothetical protein ACFX13_031350 [Malus domestica]
MEISVGVWAAVVLGGLPLLGLLFWWWNELRYVLPLKLQRSATGAKLLTGLMGFPFIGELLPFLWYFKFLCRPNEFINAKRAQYGDGVGMYRTHLFGSPSIITCFPAVNKFVLQSSDIFTLVWPSNMIFLVMFAVHGKSHERLKSYITKVINQPDALRGIALLVQPQMIASLESWAQKGRINAYDEVKKLRYQAYINFASKEKGKEIKNPKVLQIAQGLGKFGKKIRGTTRLLPFFSKLLKLYP